MREREKHSSALVKRLLTECCNSSVINQDCPPPSKDTLHSHSNMPSVPHFTAHAKFWSELDVSCGLILQYDPLRSSTSYRNKDYFHYLFYAITDACWVFGKLVFTTFKSNWCIKKLKTYLVTTTTVDWANQHNCCFSVIITASYCYHGSLTHIACCTFSCLILMMMDEGWCIVQCHLHCEKLLLVMEVIVSFHFWFKFLLPLWNMFDSLRRICSITSVWKKPFKLSLQKHRTLKNKHPM